MKYIFFSKLVKEQSISELIETLKTIKVDGVDLTVRDGYPVNPGNARDMLPKAAKQIRDAGLDVPLVSAATNLTDPSAKEAEDLFAACHDAKVPHLKLGYWNFKPGDYWKLVDSARRDIEGFARLATRFGVKACFHTHSGKNLMASAGALMHLIRGFPPAQIGAYLDPGHLALNGEPLDIAFSMSADYLSLVAIKDSKWIPQDGPTRRKSQFLPMGQGFVDWHEMLRTLKALSFTGPLSFHSEYEGLTTPQLIEQTRKDVAFLRGIETEVSSKS